MEEFLERQESEVFESSANRLPLLADSLACMERIVDRVLGLQAAELVLIGYNTPIHYAPDPSQDALAGFHNRLVMQAGAYQNGTWVVGVAKGGVEEGVDSLAQSCIVAPSGQIVAQATNEIKRTITDADHDRLASAYLKRVEAAASPGSHCSSP